MGPDTEVYRTSDIAMHTRWGLELWGRDRATLRDAAQAAFDEVARLDGQLSRFRESSDIADLNARAADTPVYTDPRIFRLLARALEMSRDTEGAFDITVAPLLNAWGFAGGAGYTPSEFALAAARDVVGASRLLLNEVDFSVTFDRPGVEIDLGAVGKGYAVECAVDILRDLDIPGALMHAGTSTVFGLGTDPAGEPWRVAIRDPDGPEGSSLQTVELRDRALSVSAPHGKGFTDTAGRFMGHVLDPRSGEPVQAARLAAVMCECAADSDALSTALLVLGEPGVPLVRAAGAAWAFVVP